MENIEQDPLFEEHIAAESIGVKDSARLQYYGESYDLLFTLVVTNPDRPLGRSCMIPTHTDQENIRAMHLVEEFSDKYPDRAEKFGYQYTS